MKWEFNFEIHSKCMYSILLSEIHIRNTEMYLVSLCLDIDELTLFSFKICQNCNFGYFGVKTFENSDSLTTKFKITVKFCILIKILDFKKSIKIDE